MRLQRYELCMTYEQNVVKISDVVPNSETSSFIKSAASPFFVLFLPPRPEKFLSEKNPPSITPIIPMASIVPILPIVPIAPII